MHDIIDDGVLQLRPRTMNGFGAEDFVAEQAVSREPGEAHHGKQKNDEREDQAGRFAETNGARRCRGHFEMRARCMPINDHRRCGQIVAHSVPSSSQDWYAAKLKGRPRKSLTISAAGREPPGASIVSPYCRATLGTSMRERSNLLNKSLAITSDHI